jgi:prophage tail gpP-like protein
MSLSLRINGKRFDFWTSMSVTRAVTQFCHSFTFSAPDALASGGGWQDILPMDDVQILAHGELICTGYIDGADIEQTPTGTRLTYFGRSKTADVYDCSAIKKGNRFSRLTPGAIARDLCASVGVDVVVQKDGSRLRDFAITHGESIYDCLLRACNPYGIQLITDELGRVVFAKSFANVKPSYRITKDTRGIVSRSRAIDFSMRHSSIRILSQAGGSNEIGSSASAKFASATVQDAVVDRPRPLVIEAEDQMTANELQLRAQFERNQRTGESDAITYVFQGFIAQDSSIFSPFVAVDVDDIYCRASGVYGVDAVVMSADASGGTTTSITLIPPQAFGFEPVVQRKKSSARTGGGGLSQKDIVDMKKYLETIQESVKQTNAKDRTR